MRFVPAVVLLALVGPASAQDGLPTDRFVATWASLPTTHFVPGGDRGPVHNAAVHLGIAPYSLLVDAFASAADDRTRGGLAIAGLATPMEPVQRTALEDLLQAQRAYAAAAGGDIQTRDATLLRQVIDGTGRSVARSDDSDEELGTAFERVIRDAPDAQLAKVETTEKAWTSYRDAFERFASAMDRPDAVAQVHEELSRRRTDELRREAPNQP